jgi:hypothetical protein
MFYVIHKPNLIIIARYSSIFRSEESLLTEQTIAQRLKNVSMCRHFTLLPSTLYHSDQIYPAANRDYDKS